MDQYVMSPLEEVKACIESCQSFVLQGGAGSGKTETLKRTVQFCEESHSEKDIVCITHTNKAVEEISGRVGSAHEISTIHSFLNNLVKQYKKNLLKLLPELFCLPLFGRLDLESYEGDEKLQKEGEHKRFKKLYGKLESSRFSIFSEKTEKVVGKREYDKEPEKYNRELNAMIEEFNHRVYEDLGERDYSGVVYNETPFNSFKDATFGHDGLVEITSLFFKKYPKLGRVVCDKYDCIFIDEYQDADEKIIRSLIYNTPDERSVTVGLFGDSEQAIYEDGIGSAKHIVDDGKLKLIHKEDNYRCSPQVIAIANKFRTDGLEQKVALKEVDGQLEKKEEREGLAKLVYAMKIKKPEKPRAPGRTASREEVQEYQKKEEKYKVEVESCNSINSRNLYNLVKHAQAEVGGHVLLKLPNKSIARDAGFGELYAIFDERFRDAREEIKKHLDRLQFGQLSEILQLFEASTTDNKSFNRLIFKLRRQGFEIHSREDKKHLHKMLSNILTSKKSAYEVMRGVIEYKIISMSERHQKYIYRKREELDRIESEPDFLAFRSLKEQGFNTKPKVLEAVRKGDGICLSEEVIDERFEELERYVKVESFYSRLFGDDLSFQEILAFYRYENDGSDFMTMHKTKGTGIENVVVVLDEFNWNKYCFSSCFREKDSNPSRQALTRKLLYVACSRAKKNLICVRLANDEEEIENMQRYFFDCEEVQV